MSEPEIVRPNEKVSCDEAWTLVRELVLLVSRYEQLTEVAAELSKNDLRRLNGIEKLLAKIENGVSHFQAPEGKEAKRDLVVIARQAHPTLQKIYEDVSDDEITLEESRDIILEKLKPGFVRAFRGMKCPFDDVRLVQVLSKSKLEISRGTLMPSSHEGGNDHVTGPAIVADRALAVLLGVSARAITDSRTSVDRKRLAYRYVEGEGVNGLSDRPYIPIMMMLHFAFGVDPKSAFKAMRVLGASKLELENPTKVTIKKEGSTKGEPKRRKAYRKTKSD